jgi:hypothetical protein
MGRNSKRSALLLGAIAVLIACLFIKRPPGTPEPIGIGIQSYTNACASVTITNLSFSPLDYVVKVERKAWNDWPVYNGVVPVGFGRVGVLQPAEVTNMFLPVMVYAPARPWRVSVFCYRNTPGPNTIRYKAGTFLLGLRMPKLAQKVWGKVELIQVSGQQMEQL